jgi:hypothetical protein
MDRTTRRQALQFAALSSTGLLAAQVIAAEPAESPNSAAKGPTFEEINQQVKSIELSAYEEGGRREITPERLRTQRAEVISDICSIFHGIRGILVALGDFPLIPGGWRDAIKLFIRAMDALCAGR